MRDYYECQRSAVLIGSVDGNEPRPFTPNDEFGGLTNAGDVGGSCYPHACGEYAEVMVAELDQALTERRPHEVGALVSCSTQSAAK